jgi:hypothetical protein
VVFLVMSVVSQMKPLLLTVGVALALAMLSTVVLERALSALRQGRRHSLERRFMPVIDRALAGCAAAKRELAATPRRHRIMLFQLLIEPLVEDRDPHRVARTRIILRSMFVRRIADRHLRSWWWWRRATALRALGLIQVKHRTARIIAALDDPHPDVRAAALEALADLKDPASLRAIVARMNDASLPWERRVAALARRSRSTARNVRAARDGMGAMKPIRPTRSAR